MASSALFGDYDAALPELDPSGLQPVHDFLAELEQFPFGFDESAEADAHNALVATPPEDAELGAAEWQPAAQHGLYLPGTAVNTDTSLVQSGTARYQSASDQSHPYFDNNPATYFPFQSNPSFREDFVYQYPDPQQVNPPPVIAQPEIDPFLDVLGPGSAPWNSEQALDHGAGATTSNFDFSKTPLEPISSLPSQLERARLQSMVSETPSAADDGSRAGGSKKYKREPPRLDPDKNWIRMNKATRPNARSGKTNNFGNGKYAKTTPHPQGKNEWTSPAFNEEFKNNTFTYNEYGELTDISYSAAELADYIYNHPFHQPNAKGRLIIWIQKVPGDSARRVETRYGLRCRIYECPCRIYKARTINTGTYRLAFDEQWATYGSTRNPMHVAGYVHLYCAERFLDFADICRRFDVRADDREIEKEPTGAWVAGLKADTEEYNVAQNFIDYCRTGACTHGPDAYRDQMHWFNYPSHPSVRGPNAPKEHRFTLAARLSEAKEIMVGAGKMAMMKRRDRSATQFFVNKGDLQMQVDAQQSKAASSRGGRGHMKGPKGKRKHPAGADDDDDDDKDGDVLDNDVAGESDTSYRPRAAKKRRSRA